METGLGSYRCSFCKQKILRVNDMTPTHRITIYVNIYSTLTHTVNHTLFFFLYSQPLMQTHMQHLNAHTQIQLLSCCTHTWASAYVHKTVLTCQEHKHFYQACLRSRFTHLIRVHTKLFVNTLQQNTHTQNHKPIYKRLTHQVKNAVGVVFATLCHTETLQIP